MKINIDPNDLVQTLKEEHAKEVVRTEGGSVDDVEFGSSQIAGYCTIAQAVSKFVGITLEKVLPDIYKHLHEFNMPDQTIAVSVLDPVTSTELVGTGTLVGSTITTGEGVTDDGEISVEYTDIDTSEIDSAAEDQDSKNEAMKEEAEQQQKAEQEAIDKQIADAINSAG